MQPDYVRISITRGNGDVAIMSFITREYRSSDGPGWGREPTAENIEKEVKRAYSDAASWRVINDSEVPVDRTFRNALRDDGKKLYHDMPHVRKIHLDRIRDARGPLLLKKDGEWMRAFGQGNIEEAARIESERQSLRDAPQDIEKRLSSAKKPGDVKKIWPEIIPKTKLYREA